MIKKYKLLKYIEKEFGRKIEFTNILFYTGFEWVNNSDIGRIEVYIGSRTERLSNDKIVNYKDYVLVESNKEIYVLTKNNERE
jgi:hypothetical protein